MFRLSKVSLSSKGHCLYFYIKSPKSIKHLTKKFIFHLKNVILRKAYFKIKVYLKPLYVCNDLKKTNHSTQMNLTYR